MELTSSRGKEVTILADFCRASSFWRVFVLGATKAPRCPLCYPSSSCCNVCNSAYISRMRLVASRRPVLFYSSLSCARLIATSTSGSIWWLKINSGACLSQFSNTWRTIRTYLLYSSNSLHVRVRIDIKRTIAVVKSTVAVFNIPRRFCGW